MTEYVIGIDIGATKSHLALFDTGGSLVEFSHWGPLNHEVLPGSFAQFEEEMGRLVTQTLSKHGLTMKQVAYSVLGVAGVDTKRQHTIISGILRRLGFERFTLANDAFLGIPAGNPSGVGVCAINGTGCTLAGINSEGRMFQIGGVGYISADFGGGGEMGRLVVSSVYSELFRKGEPTSMTPAFFEKLGITSKYDFVERIYDKIDDGSLDVASCAKMLFEAVYKNDRVAMKILRDEADSYARGISCMIDEMNFSPAEELGIVLAGSIFVKSEHPLLIDTLKETLNRDKPNYRISYTLLDVPPVAGAVIWAINVLKGKGSSAGAHFEKVRARLRY